MSTVKHVEDFFKHLLSQALTKDHDKKKMPRVKVTKCIGLVMATKGEMLDRHLEESWKPQVFWLIKESII